MVQLGIRSEKYRGTEDALEGGDQSPVLGTALLNAECIQHLGGAIERDPGGLLANCHRCQEDRNQAVLSPGKPVARVAGDLEHEAPVSPFVKEASVWRALHWKTAEYKRLRSPASAGPSGSRLPDGAFVWR